MRKEKSRKTAGVGPISFVLALVMLISVLSSCSLLQEQPSRAFENLDQEKDAPLTTETEENIPSDTAELAETSKSNISYDRPAIHKGAVPVFTERNNNSNNKNEDTTGTSTATGPTKAVTPTPTPTPTPQAPRISSNVGAVHAGPPYTIRVFVAEQRVVVYGTTASGTEVPIRKMVTSTGVKGYSTPLTGENHHYYLGGGVLWIKFKLYGESFHQYATRFYGINPKTGRSIGTDFFFHTPYYTVKGNPGTLNVRSYNKLGRRDSHGCIRLNAADARFIYSLRGTRSKVKVLASAKGYNIDGVPGLPKITIKVSRSDPRYGWDPYDPHPKNPWKNKINSPPRIIGAAQTITAGEVAGFDYLKGVEAYDFANNKLEVTYTGNVDVTKAGTYAVTYTAKDAVGNTSTLKLEHIVKPAPTEATTTPTTTAKPTTTPTTTAKPPTTTTTEPAATTTEPVSTTTTEPVSTTTEPVSTTTTEP
ncbi:MAG: immunoglobulin-like domain-containing protein [Saccharofermentanales bacterium]|jgi:hypothetical protein|nr:DUF5011 domain-containing protein [Bacillota bacterium]